MKRLLTCALLVLGFAAPELRAQGLSASKLSSTPKTARRAAPAETPLPSTSPKSEADDPIKQTVGDNGLMPGQPVITEIFADEAFFDSANHIGIFTGHVVVNDPRFNVQSDKLTIYLTKNEPPAEGEQPAQRSTAQTLEKAVAEGNVGVVRERPDDKGGPPVRSVGRADIATYTPGDGNVELRGTPRVQSGMNTHVAMSPDTVMVLENGGQLITKGPSRTEIRQTPSAGQSPAPAASPAKP